MITIMEIKQCYIDNFSILMFLKICVLLLGIRINNIESESLIILKLFKGFIIFGINKF